MKALFRTFALGVFLLFVFLIVASCASKSEMRGIPIGTDIPGGDPWFRAVRSADLVTMQKMVDEGYQVDVPNKMGVTALMTASRDGGPEIIKWLLENGADASRLDQDGQSALVYALVGNSSGVKLASVVEILIKAGANPFAIDKLGFQPVQEMLALDMDDQIRKLKFTDKKPCDLMPNRPDEVKISKAARRMDKIKLAEFLEAEGCW